MADTPEVAEGVPTGIQLTVLDPAYQADPYPVLERLRRADPVHHDTVLNRYVLTRAADVQTLLWDRALSVDPRKAAPGTFEANFVFAERDREPSMLFSDPPYHTRLRKLVSKAFSGKAVRDMRPRIEAITGELLDSIDPSGEVDLMKSFAEPLPTIVIAEMLGVDPEDREDFKRWSDTGVMSFNPLLSADERRLVNEASAALDAYLRKALAQRRSGPRADLMTSLLQAEESGERLTEDEIVTMCALLLAAGNVTTTDLIGNGVHALLRHPDELRKLKDDPSLIKNAVEEMLRFDGPVTQSGRTPLEPYEIGGVPIGAGQSVTPSLAAANRDPAVHEDPNRFDITRSNTEHHSFGGGVHYCLGAALARAEAQIAIGMLVSRFPAIRAGESPIEWRRVPGFRGLSSLPVHLT
jgi:cytochrome P450